MMLAILCGRPARAGETPVSAVNVTALPQGEREIAAVAGASGYVLRLAANGEVTRLADLDGNVLLETVQSAQGKTPALAVFEAAGGAPNTCRRARGTHLDGKFSKWARRSSENPGASTSRFPRARRLARNWSAISCLLRRLRLPCEARGGPVGGSEALIPP